MKNGQKRGYFQLLEFLKHKNVQKNHQTQLHTLANKSLKLLQKHLLTFLDISSVLHYRENKVFLLYRNAFRYLHVGTFVILYYHC